MAPRIEGHGFRRWCVDGFEGTGRGTNVFASVSIGEEGERDGVRIEDEFGSGWVSTVEEGRVAVGGRVGVNFNARCLA